MSLSERALSIRLHGNPVGTLVRRKSEDDTPRFELHFDEHYINLISRPVLSLKCRDWRLEVGRRFNGRMPAFLTNLIPEHGGALRRRITRAAAISEDDEFALLEFVGKDMSGAITVEETGVPAPGSRFVEERSSIRYSDSVEQLRMSGGLGGMQLKFSVDKDDRISLPVSGRGGRWILKIPDTKHECLVRAEYAAMLWAAEVGFEVPQVEIVDPRAVDGLPEDSTKDIAEALLVRRFDRLEDYRPVHMEELTSVLGMHPEDKYADRSSPHRYNLVAVARVVKLFAGAKGLRTFLGRIAFDVMVGNGDAHLKNWAFVFPDGKTAVFAPAYDIVPTILYGYPAQLSLAFTSERIFRAFDASRVRQFAMKLNEDPDEFLDLVLSTVERALNSFHSAMKKAALPEPMIHAIERHWQGLPLVEGM